MKRVIDFFAALAGALLFVAGLLVLLFLSGCANVAMTDDEAKACRDAGCTAWTDRELHQLVQRAGMEGYFKGWKDANRQAGRGS